MFNTSIKNQPTKWQNTIKNDIIAKNNKKGRSMGIPSKQINDDQLVADSLAQAAKFMEITHVELANMMGISASAFSRAIQKGFTPQSLKGQVALMVIRIYRSLSALSGRNHEFMTHFLRTKNKYFDQTPLQTMATLEGLVVVNQYLDAMRGKV